MDELVAHNRIHALGRYFIVANLDIQVLGLIIIRLETAVIFQNLLAIRLLMGDLVVVGPVNACLTWLQH